MRKVLISIVLLPVLLYAGAKGYLWYSIYSEMEDAKKTIAPFAKLEYQSIQFPLTDPFGVRGITITPHAVNDTIRIGSALVHTSGITELFRLIKSYYNERMPERLRLSVKRIGLNLNGELVSWIANNQQSNLFGTPLDALGCGNRRYFSPADLLEMGYDKLRLDTTLSYQFERGIEAIELYVKFNVHDAMSIALDVSMPEFVMPAVGGNVGLQIPTLTNFSVNLEDLSFNEKRNKYCATVNGTDVPKFIDHHIQAVKVYAEENGFPVSDQLLAGYRNYVAASGNITINANPYDPIDAMALANLNARQFVEWLALEVNISGKVIEELLVFASPAESPAPAEQDKAKVALDTYKPTPVGELDRHINRLLKIRTVDGKSHHAYLSRVEASNLVLTKELVGGSVVFSVPIAQIQEVLVLY